MQEGKHEGWKRIELPDLFSCSTTFFFYFWIYSEQASYKYCRSVELCYWGPPFLAILKQVEEIPDSFPFKITDKKGLNDITLTRTYQGEKIEVVVSMPSLVTGDEAEDDQDEDDKEGDEDKDDDGEKPPKSTIPLTVTISKSGGPSLEFCCTAYPDEIMIDTLSVKQQPSGEEDEDLIAYEGPEFNDLDENLQRAFHKYLELRGITPMTTNFLHEYMINKDSREYLFWLTKLKDFVKQ